MAIYIALLRAVNVSGHNKIRMADLKKTLESFGLSHVQTYIQSGNVLFESDDRPELIREQLENEIKREFGLSIDVIIRTAEELKQVIANCPFDEESLPEGAGLHVSFLAETPTQDRIALLSVLEGEPDQCQIVGRDLYLLLHQGVKNSKVLAVVPKLRVPATARNWRTVNKLIAMINEMEK
jgi:uncharacterized protein (DUF1697 family)